MQREKLVRMSVAVYIVILAISATLLSADGTNVPIYLLLAVVSLVPLIWGRGYGRVIGVIALAAALGLALRDYRNGLALDERLAAIRQDLKAAATRESETRPGDPQPK